MSILGAIGRGLGAVGNVIGEGIDRAPFGQPGVIEQLEKRQAENKTLAKSGLSKEQQQFQAMLDRFQGQLDPDTYDVLSRQAQFYFDPTVFPKSSDRKTQLGALQGQLGQAVAIGRNAATTGQLSAKDILGMQTSISGILAPHAQNLQNSANAQQQMLGQLIPDLPKAYQPIAQLQQQQVGTSAGANILAAQLAGQLAPSMWNLENASLAGRTPMRQATQQDIFGIQSGTNSFPGQ